MRTIPKDRRPAEHPDVARCLADCARIQRAAETLAAHLADVHALAFEQIRRGESDRRAQPGPRTLEAVGSAQARKCWHDAADQLRRSAVDLGAVAASLEALLAGGSPAPLRGTLIPRAEFRAALEARDRRLGRRTSAPHLAEYEPERTRGTVQPGYPKLPELRAAKPVAGEKRRGWRHG